jgi:hypothetical protein
LTDCCDGERLSQICFVSTSFGTGRRLKCISTRCSHSLFPSKRQNEAVGVAEFSRRPLSSVPDIDSDHLHVFIVLAGELNYPRAADRLQPTQAAVRKQIADLEKELRFRLFTRDNGRGVKLTTVGRVVVEEIRSALLHIERAFQRARAAQERSNNALTIEHSPDAHQVLAMYAQRHVRLPLQRERQ